VSELAWLQARGDWVSDRISAGDAWFNTQSQATTPGQTQSSTSQNSGQRVLYLLGALSVITAVGVFTSIAWKNIGAYGQAAALILITAAASFLAIKTRTKLAGLANTGAVIATAVAITGFLAATQFGLLPSSWLNNGSVYPLVVVIGVGTATLLSGLRLNIFGWVVTAPFAIFTAWLLLTQSVVRVNIDDKYMFTLLLVTGTAVILGYEYLIDLFARYERRFFAVTVIAVVGQAAVATVLLFTSLGNLAVSSVPLVDASATLIFSAAWAAIALRWQPKSARTGLTNGVKIAAPYVAAVFAGIGLAWINQPDHVSSATAWKIWTSILIPTIVGAVLYVLPLVRKFANPQLEIAVNVAAVSTWFSTFSLSQNQNRADVSVAYIFGAFFIVIAAASATRWLAGQGIIHFVISVSAGVFAVSTILGEALGPYDTPEYLAIPIAVWLFIALWVLRSRATTRINSAIWLGIPFAAAIIPSSLIAVASLTDDRGVTTGDWARLWIVLIIGVSGTIFGASKRIAGILWPATAAYVLSTFPQLFVDLGLIIPRWVFFAFLGAILLVTAARFERLQKLRAETGSWSEVFR